MKARMWQLFVVALVPVLLLVVMDGRVAAQNASAATIAARQHFFGLDNVDPTTGAVRSDRVIISWQGVSNFAASFNGHVVLLNAWIARGWWTIGEISQTTKPPLWPNQDYVRSTPQELAALKPEAIFFGHGHGDHAGDTPFVVRANPGITVLGAAEHCNDLRAEVKDVDYKCISVFPVDAPFGATMELNTLLSGVQITAIKQPHSNTTTVTPTNQPFTKLVEGQCQAFVDYPGDRNEPRTWSAMNSGSVTAMWQFRIGDFALVWQDTAGPMKDTPLPAVLAKLPPTDVRLGAIAVAARSVIGEHLAALKPKIFIPVHHDPCGAVYYKQLMDYLETLPKDIRPAVWFMSDPADYLRPISFDPKAKIWANK